MSNFKKPKSYGFDPFSKKKHEYERDYGRYSIAKIHGVYEDLGLVVGELDENIIGAIPIEWFTKVKENTWRPNGLACPYIYMDDFRQLAIDKYNQIKNQIEDNA
jgi:hypothetical protein